MRLSIAVALGLSVIGSVVGCGDDSNTAGGGSGAGGGGDGGSGGAGGQIDCSPYELPQDPPVQTIPITVVNDTAASIYLGAPAPLGCESTVSFHTSDASGEVKNHLGSCELTCPGLVSGTCACAEDCAAPVVVEVFPGGSYALSWTALLYHDVEMPEGCYEDPGCYQAGATCAMPETPSEALDFTVDGYPELADCATPPCTCDGGVAGSCIVEGASAVSGAPAHATTTWQVTDESITITFQ